MMIGLPRSLVSAVANRLVLNFAAMVFLGVTLFLTWQEHAWSQLFNLRGALFVLCGLLVAGGMIGAVLASLHQRLARWVVLRSGNSLDTRSTTIIRWSGTIVMLCQVLLVYYLTIWAYGRWILNVPT